MFALDHKEEIDVVAGERRSDRTHLMTIGHPTVGRMQTGSEFERHAVSDLDRIRVVPIRHVAHAEERGQLAVASRSREV